MAARSLMGRVWVGMKTRMSASSAIRKKEDNGYTLVNADRTMLDAEKEKDGLCVDEEGWTKVEK